MTTSGGAGNSARKLRAIHRKLMEEYGPQGWWPVLQRGELKYFPRDYSIPRTDAQRFEITIGALLTQNASWKNAAQALMNLKAAGTLSPRKILKAPKARLEKLVRPARYYRQKAERLKLLAKAYLGLSPKMPTEELRKKLLGVKGVGNETADSILLYAFKRPVFMIDAYTVRLCRKHKLCRAKTYGEHRKFFEENLPKDRELFNEFHALIVRWGQDYSLCAGDIL